MAEARNGEEALKLIRSMNLDLSLIDFKMPGQNGLGVLEEARRINPELDVIMITAYGIIETAVEAMKAGTVVICRGSLISMEDLPFKSDELK